MSDSAHNVPQMMVKVGNNCVHGWLYVPNNKLAMMTRRVTGRLDKGTPM